MLALHVEPIPLPDHWSVPPGERSGAFSISPAGSVPGSPGGVHGAQADVGEGGHGPGGDASAAVGDAKGKPEGGGQGPSVVVSATPSGSVTGPAGVSGITAGTLPPLKPEALVYPVKPETPKAHAPTFVVSSSSGGGGGLRIYGVLHSRKIYTVYLSMPGKSWILQYCARESTPPPDPGLRAVQINIQPPLAPPAPLEEFDFHRPTDPPDSPDTMIILYGIIHEDGSVSDLKALQGPDPFSNAAACAAFARWKFQPALRAGKPLALEILLGIPQ